MQTSLTFTAVILYRYTFNVDDEVFHYHLHVVYIIVALEAD